MRAVVSACRQRPRGPRRSAKRFVALGDDELNGLLLLDELVTWLKR